MQKHRAKNKPATHPSRRDVTAGQLPASCRHPAVLGVARGESGSIRLRVARGREPLSLSLEDVATRRLPLVFSRTLPTFLSRNLSQFFLAYLLIKV